MNYLTARFSLHMLDGEQNLTLIQVRRVNPEDVPLDVKNCISHNNMASIVGNILGRTLKCSKESIMLKEGDKLYVALHKGAFLPANATRLPAGATISFLEITLKPTNGCEDDISFLGEANQE